MAKKKKKFSAKTMEKQAVDCAFKVANGDLEMEKVPPHLMRRVDRIIEVSGGNVAEFFPFSASRFMPEFDETPKGQTEFRAS